MMQNINELSRLTTYLISVSTIISLVFFVSGCAINSSGTEQDLKGQTEDAKKALGAEHQDEATSLNNLATLYFSQGQYRQAEPLLRRSSAIREQALGPDYLDVATSLNNLAMLYYTQGQYAQAEPLLRRSLEIREQALGPDHPDVARGLNNLTGLYYT